MTLLIKILQKIRIFRQEGVFMISLFLNTIMLCSLRGFIRAITGLLNVNQKRAILK